MRNKWLVCITLVLTLSTSQVMAQDNVDVGSESTSDSSATNSLIFEGSSGSAPAIGGASAMHTAPCIIGKAGGVSIIGFGVTRATGVIEKSCIIREEAAWLAQLINAKPSEGRRAAIYHACANNKRLQGTLVAMGACVVQRN